MMVIGDSEGGNVSLSRRQLLAGVAALAGTMAFTACAAAGALPVSCHNSQQITQYQLQIHNLQLKEANQGPAAKAQSNQRIAALQQSIASLQRQCP